MDHRRLGEGTSAELRWVVKRVRRTPRAPGAVVHALSAAEEEALISCVHRGPFVVAFDGRSRRKASCMSASSAVPVHATTSMAGRSLDVIKESTAAELNGVLKTMSPPITG